MFQFAFVGIAGAGAPVVSLDQAASVTDDGFGSNADARIRIGADGVISGYAANGVGYTIQGNWVVPTTPYGNDYWVRCTVTAGALTTGTTGSWIDTATGPEWRCARTTAGTNTATITLEIASDAAGTTIVATKAGIVLTATK